MAKKKKAAKKKTTAGRTRAAAAKRAGGRSDLFRDTWQQTLRALTAAEAEVEKQIKGLLKRNKIKAPDASAALRQVTTRIQKERRQAVKEFESRLKRVQNQVRTERRAFDKMVADAVQGALASFNIPSRREVTELTRKVNQLSRQIDALPRRRSRSAS